MSAADITLRYAETDADVIAIHGFLAIVFGSHLPGPIDARDSSTEVWRVCREDVALMAIRGDRLVGTIGLVRPTFWWNNKIAFLASRWAFALPGSGAWKPLLKEAKAIAKASDLEFHLISEERGKLTIFNRSKRRAVRHPALANSPNNSRALAT